MSQKNKFDFSEFFTTPINVWKEKIIQELEEKDLDWNYKDLAFKKVYSQEDLPSFDFKNFHTRYILKTPRHWYTRELIPVNNLVNANQLALNALRSGADAIEYFIKDEVSSTPSISTLVKDIPCKFSPVHFHTSFSLKSFSEEISKEKLEEMKGSIIHNFFSIQKNQVSYTRHLGEIVESLKLLENVPQLRIICIQTTELHKKSVSPQIEIAYAIAAAIDILDALTSNHITIHEAFSRLEFSFSIGKSFFPEIAKLRAFRFLWNEVIKTFSSDRDSFSTPLHCRTASHQFSEDPYYNMLHNTTEAMAAVIGGCDSLTILPFDLNQKENNTFSSRVSRNISLLMKEEAYLNAVTDPGAGSYTIEQMTFQLVTKSLDLLRQIENKGGLSKAITSM